MSTGASSYAIHSVYLRQNDVVITKMLASGFTGEISMPAATEVKRETLNIRIKPEERNLIDRAAKTRGKNRTDFILDAARLAAEDALLDQVAISVSPQAYEQFLARLDMPPQANERLRKTMQTPAPWERG
ncbi:type II toxin-antitoxin system TacA family antitoxin [Polaromonas naphthalenivorans]|nr:DUF1778 domain-containing protein [Polaromonas naphthalenivorans]